MGIDANHARFLLSARKRGVSFRRSVMLGRQFCNLDAGEIQCLLREFGLEPDADVLRAAKAYGEPFFRFLGAEEIVSVDASAYQGASCIHDMNLPIPAEWESRFDVVVEGGSLEHIFNFPVSVRNCMRMLVPGGYFLGIAPANSFCGHGFYQFSPDLFFRVFSRENGFLVERAILCGVEAGAEWYEVEDPLEACQFMDDLGSPKPTYLLIQARKIEERPIFTRYPEQSVYTFLWNGVHPGEDRSKLLVPTRKT